MAIRKRIALLFACAVALTALWPASALADSNTLWYDDVVESTPVAVAGLSVTVGATAHWTLPLAPGTSRIELQLHLKNGGAKDLIVALMDTMSFHVTGPGGNDVAVTYGRLRSAFVKPVLIHAGQEYAIVYWATLDSDQQGAYGLRFEDRSGGETYAHPLAAGMYKIGFTITCAPAAEDEIVACPKGAVPWYGSLTTSNLSVDIGPANTK